MRVTCMNPLSFQGSIVTFLIEEFFLNHSVRVYFFTDEHALNKEEYASCKIFCLEEFPAYQWNIFMGGDVEYSTARN